MSQFTFAFVALVAQWIARWIPNPKVRGSNPRWGIFFFFNYKNGVKKQSQKSLSGVGFEPTHTYVYQSLNLAP